jgi:hypothetical protein
MSSVFQEFLLIKENSLCYIPDVMAVQMNSIYNILHYHERGRCFSEMPRVNSYFMLYSKDSTMSSVICGCLKCDAKRTVKYVIQKY